jgi:hypothetical protein
MQVIVSSSHNIHRQFYIQHRVQGRIVHTLDVQHESTMPCEELRGRVWPDEVLMLVLMKMLAARCLHAGKWLNT